MLEFRAQATNIFNHPNYYVDRYGLSTRPRLDGSREWAACGNSRSQPGFVSKDESDDFDDEERNSANKLWRCCWRASLLLSYAAGTAAGTTTRFACRANWFW